MEQNKTGKYFKYAIGEIVLVVIGILIALQINNWNDSRKLANQETLYLNRLISDNQQDLITFSKNINDLEKGNESIERFSEALKNNTISDSLLIHRANEFLKYGSIFPIFYSTKSTFNDLSSTGNLSVIENSELRDQIINHYTEHDQMEQRIQVSTEWTLPLDGPFYSNNTVMNFEPSTAFLYPESTPNVLASQLREDKLTYINNIAVHYWINTDAINRFKKLKKLTSVLIKDIQAQLTE